jgi:hypothetical protein
MPTKRANCRRSVRSLALAATKTKARKQVIEAVRAAIDAELSVEMFRASLANPLPRT